MSYNGSGTFTINSTGQPVVAGTVITASAFNALTADLATGLTTAITKDGQTTTTARITFAQGVTSSLVTDSSSTSTGSIITAGGVGIAKALYVGTTATVSQITSASATALTLQSAGTTAITVSTAQNVGIGTVSPACKADVAGAIRTTSTSAPASGVGLELSYGVTANTADILSYDRTGAAFKNIEMRCSNLIFNTGGGGERMRIDSSGNVGIGTSSPTAGYRLQAVSAGGSNLVASTSSDASGVTTYMQANGATAGVFGTLTNHPQTFVTNNTERMRIDSSGNLLVGQTAAPLALAGSCQIANASSVGQFSGGDGALARTYSFGRDNVTTGNFVFTFNGSLISSINAATGVYTPISDARVKKNITPIIYGLNEILKLNPVMYNMIDESDDSKKHIGLIAQETKSVIDETVNDLVTVTQEMKDLGAKEQYYGLDKSVLVPVLIKAMQEQQALIQSLTTRITALEAK